MEKLTFSIASWHSHQVCFGAYGVGQHLAYLHFEAGFLYGLPHEVSSEKKGYRTIDRKVDGVVLNFRLEIPQPLLAVIQEWEGLGLTSMTFLVTEEAEIRQTSSGITELLPQVLGVEVNRGRHLVKSFLLEDAGKTAKKKRNRRKH